MTMQLCRYFVPGLGARLGLVEAGMVYDLTARDGRRFASLAAVLARSGDTSVALGAELRQAIRGAVPTHRIEELDRPPADSAPYLLKPTDFQEIWAAGVTYVRSKQARQAESAAARFYARVYEAERPELFLKATPSRTVGPHEAVCIRSDSHWTVPEPELALVLDADLRIVGYTLGNDMSARDIEGENPLYLPQAKIYAGCCAIGPAITLSEDAEDPRRIEISCTIYRAGQVVAEGTISTSQMKRGFNELIAFLGRDNVFPDGVVLLTGTGIVPSDDVSLQDGDVVEIRASGIGVLRNPVRGLDNSSRKSRLQG